MTKFRDRKDPGYEAVRGVLRRWVKEIEENLTSESDPVPAVVLEGIRESWVNSLPQGIGSPGTSFIYTQNNSGGGLIVQGNNINTANGPIYFGK